MHVAVGRLHLAVTFEQPHRRRPPQRIKPPSGEAVAKAYARRQLMEQVEADRQRWSNETQGFRWWR